MTAILWAVFKVFAVMGAILVVLIVGALLMPQIEDRDLGPDVGK